MLGHLVHGRRLGLHHVRVELGRTPHGLARVVDDEVEAAAGRQHLAAERLDARRVAQVEPEDLEPVRPVGEVGLLRVTRRRIAREPRRDDHVRAGAQQLEPGLEPDLDASARQQRHAPAQVGRLRALPEVQVGTRRAQLIVEVMDDGVLLLAHVAVLALGRFLTFRLVLWRARRNVLWIESFGREHVRRAEHRPSPQRADACLAQHALVAPDARGFALAIEVLHHPPPLGAIGTVDVGDRLEEPLALVDGQAGQHGAIGGDGLEQGGHLPHAFEQRETLGVGPCVWGCRGHRQQGTSGVGVCKPIPSALMRHSATGCGLRAAGYRPVGRLPPQVVRAEDRPGAGRA